MQASQNQIDYGVRRGSPGETAPVSSNIDQAGEDHFANSATVETASDGRDRVVRAQFEDAPLGDNEDVTDAVIVVAEPDAVGPGPRRPLQRAVRGHGPGTSGDTNDPDLVRPSWSVVEIRT